MPWWSWLIIGLAAFAAITVILLVYWNNAIKTVRFTIEKKNLPRGFDGFVIAHISDFHNKYYGKGARRLVKRVIKSKPDIIVISGDMIQTPKMDNALALTQALVSIAPVYYVTGNHERYVEEYPEFRAKMKEQGVTVLEDETCEFERNGDRIAVSGALDPRFYMERGKERAERFAENVSKLKRNGMFNLLISHRPEFMKVYAAAGFDLVLGGHAHAGQVRFPFVGAIFTPGERFHPHYIVGRYDEEDTTMIVSGGLGSSNIVPRILNRPQLVIETLKCE